MERSPGSSSRTGPGGGPRRARTVGGARLAGLLLCAVLLALGTQAATAQPRAGEYQVKAAFLFNFTLFTDWPQAAFAGPAAPLAICILGDDPFGSFLDDTVRGERVAGRDLVVRRYREVGEIEDCQVVFVSRSQSRQLAHVLASLAGRSILTVSDIADFAQRGGMICLAEDARHLRLRINLEAAQAAGLTISAKVLRIAEVVRGVGRTGMEEVGHIRYAAP